MKQSRWAGTSQYLAIQAVPLLVLTILAHWQGWIPTEALFYLLALVGFLALGAVVLGVQALIQIWAEGEVGAKAALSGLVLGILLLVPYIVSGAMVLSTPKLTDVTTRYAPPMVFDVAQSQRTASMNSLAPASVTQIERQFALYPVIAARQFAVPPERLFEALTELASNSGWRVLDAQAPDGTLAGGRIEAISYSPILRLPSAILIETGWAAGRTRVDFRAAALWAEHDLGTNVARLLTFFEQLEADIRGIREEGVAIYDDDEISEPLPLNVPRPRPR